MEREEDDEESVPWWKERGDYNSYDTEEEEEEEREEEESYTFTNYSLTSADVPRTDGKYICVG